MKIDISKITGEVLSILRRVPFSIAKSAFIVFIIVLVLEFLFAAFIFYHYGFPEEESSAVMSGPKKSEFEQAIELIQARKSSRDRASFNHYTSPFLELAREEE